MSWGTLWVDGRKRQQSSGPAVLVQGRRVFVWETLPPTERVKQAFIHMPLWQKTLIFFFISRQGAILVHLFFGIRLRLADLLGSRYDGYIRVMFHYTVFWFTQILYSTLIIPITLCRVLLELSNFPGKLRCWSPIDNYSLRIFTDFSSGSRRLYQPWDNRNKKKC